MLCSYIGLLRQIDKLNDFADSMLEYRTTDFIHMQRVCGYVKDYEVKLKKRHPKTYKKYEDAKERWFKAYDSSEEAYTTYRLEEEYKTILRKQNQLDVLENEIKVIKEEVERIKINLDHRLNM